MTTVTVNAAISAKLGELSTPVVLCDEAGRVLGHFQPAGIPVGIKSLRELSPYSDEQVEELQRNATGGRSLREIIADLEQRPT
jgi:hypothetical protein